MYKEHIVELYLNKSRLLIRDEAGQLLPSNTRIGQVAEEIYNMGSCIPDLYVRGTYIRGPYGEKDSFLVSKNGDHLLFITGIPKGSTIVPAKIRGSLYHSLWEEAKKDILFQILDVSHKYHLTWGSFDMAKQLNFAC